MGDNLKNKNNTVFVKDATTMSQQNCLNAH